MVEGSYYATQFGDQCFSLMWSMSRVKPRCLGSIDAFGACGCRESHLRAVVDPVFSVLVFHPHHHPELPRDAQLCPLSIQYTQLIPQDSTNGDGIPPPPTHSPC